MLGLLTAFKTLQVKTYTKVELILVSSVQESIYTVHAMPISVKLPFQV